MKLQGRARRSSKYFDRCI